MVTWSITPSSSSVPLQGKLPLPPRPPEHPGSWVGCRGWPCCFPPTLMSPTQGLRGCVLPPSCGPQEASGVAFVHKDQGTVLRGKAADFLQGCDVTIHGKGPISGHKAQPMLLQRRYGRQWLVSRVGPSHSLSVLLGALKAHSARAQNRDEHTCTLVLRLAHPLPPLVLPHLLQGSLETCLATGQ